MYYRNGKYVETMMLSKQQWLQRLKNIFNRNIKNKHISKDLSGIAHDLCDCILETECDTCNVTIDVEKYKQLYKIAGIIRQ